MICATQKQEQENKLTLQSIQKSFSKSDSSNTAWAVIPDKNIGWYVLVRIRTLTVVKYEQLTSTVSYLAYTVCKDRRISLNVNHTYRHDWVHIEKPTVSTALVWCAWEFWRPLPLSHQCLWETDHM